MSPDHSCFVSSPGCQLHTAPASLSENLHVTQLRRLHAHRFQRCLICLLSSSSALSNSLFITLQHGTARCWQTDKSWWTAASSPVPFVHLGLEIAWLFLGIKKKSYKGIKIILLSLLQPLDVTRILGAERTWALWIFKSSPPQFTKSLDLKLCHRCTIFKKKKKREA